jgi:hypothetical protein
MHPSIGLRLRRHQSNQSIIPARMQPYRIHPSIGLRLRRHQSNQMANRQQRPSSPTENIFPLRGRRVPAAPSGHLISSTGPITSYLSDQSWLNWNSRASPMASRSVFVPSTCGGKWFKFASWRAAAPRPHRGGLVPPRTRRKKKQRPPTAMASHGRGGARWVIWSL